MIFVAILLAVTIKKPDPDFGKSSCDCGGKECLMCNWPGFGGATINAFKKQTKSLFSGTLFPLMLSNLF